MLKSLSIPISGSMRSLREVFGVLRRHKIVATALTGTVFVASNLADSLVGKALETVFPVLDDTAAIIQHQDEKFAAMSAALDKVSDRLGGEDREALAALQGALAAAKTSSDLVSARLGDLAEENRRLREAMKEQGGAEGGVDFLVPLAEGIKLDAGNTLGFHSIYRGGAYMSVSAVDPAQSVGRTYVLAGNGLHYTAENGRKCLVTYLGATQKDKSETWLGKFGQQCKAA